MKVYTLKIRVAKDDLDHLNHVNNVRYVHWIQEIAREHWEKVAGSAMKSDIVWVVRRHEIDYKFPAVLGDTLLLKTFISESKGPLSTRIVEMYHAENGKLILRAKTIWCLLDAKQLKPIPISSDISNLFIEIRETS